MWLSPHHRHVLLDAARDTIRSALRAGGSGSGNPGPAPAAVAAPAAAAGITPAPDPVLAQPAGCFVTLHRLGTHELRGCVGRLDAVDPLLTAVRGAAVGVLNDPRFAANRITLDELPRLEIDISVLTPLQPAPSPLDFDLLSDGVYLTWGDRAGCFLPQVARETGWTRPQLLARLCTEKLGLPPDAWQDPAARLYRFGTELVGPEPFGP